MKLYFSPGACSLSPHIVLRELGVEPELDRVDFATKTTKSGENYLNVNPKGYVPALKLDNGDVLTEGPAIVQYLADQHPNAGLAPKPGTFERARLQEWLNFISTELHKAYSPLFNKKTPDEYKKTVKENLEKRIAWVDQELAKRPFVMGDHFGVADAYLFTVLSWSKHVDVDLSKYAAVSKYLEAVGARPAVVAARDAERAAK